MAQEYTAQDDEHQPITATTQLHRHLLNDWLRDGRLTRQSFALSSADRREADKMGVVPAVSLDHGNLVSPQEAHRLRRERGKRSDGVATITGENCFKYGLVPVHDAIGTPEHVSMPIPQDWNSAKQRHIARLMAAEAEITVPLHHHEQESSQK